jgi:WD40 repeat protein
MQRSFRDTELNTVNALASSPNWVRGWSRTVAVGSGANVSLWNVETVTRIAYLSGHTGPVTALAISPDGKTLVSGSEGKAPCIILWDIASGFLRHRIAVSRPVSSIVFAPNGRFFASATHGGIELRDAEGTYLSTLRNETDQASSLCISPDGHILIAAAKQHIVLWDLPSGKPVFRVEGSAPIAMSADGQRLASAIRGGVRIWNVLRS